MRRRRTLPVLHNDRELQTNDSCVKSFRVRSGVQDDTSQAKQIKSRSERTARDDVKDSGGVELVVCT
jgi:hypothetical protein